MTHEGRESWETRHREATPGTPEPSLIEMMPLMARGLVLDIAAGAGRHAIALARAGFRVVAVDYAATAMHQMHATAAAEHLPIMPVVADLEDGLPFAPGSFDAVVNTNFLDRNLMPLLKSSLRIGGTLLFDTFLIDQAASGHPRDPRFLLRHYELREMLSDMELIRYREGLTVYSPEKSAWRATALARRI
ncbi:MAG TPA: methyltransferase domain-containing protein [Candidatus Binataceae bacterium]|nr:methyltransferase domain-containing protein [Candidatus Binataceae bacterium]